MGIIFFEVAALEVLAFEAIFPLLFAKNREISSFI